MRAAAGGRERTDPPRLVVDRSTTVSDSLDLVEIGWIEQHVGVLERTSKTKTDTLSRRTALVWRAASECPD